MLYMTSFSTKEGRLREFQDWVKKNEDVMQKSAPRGWTYRGTYGYVLGFGRYGGAQLWECNKYGDFDAWREHSDPGWTRIAEELDGFLSEQPGESVLLREMGDVKVIERSSHRVIFEDLEESDDGWNWSRDIVTLRPPNRWHMDGIGNRRDVTADYVLSPLPDGRTRFDLRWSRRPKVPEAKKLTKAEREASTMRAWKRFAAAMEQDYRRSRRRRTK